MIYVDAGFLIAVFDPDDAWSNAASAFLFSVYADRSITLVTVREVLNEFLAHFSRADGVTRRHAADFVKDLLHDSKYRVVAFDNDLYWEALLLYEARPDKRYSMVDCIGMTVMRRHGIQDVVATDRDFEQEGFSNLMRPVG